MSVWATVAATAGLIALSAFFVVIEFALIAARRNRLEQQADTSASARAALRGMNELTVMLALAQLGITACTFALGAITKPAVDAWLEPLLLALGLELWISSAIAFTLSLIVVTFLHLVVGEMAPKSWALAHPEFAAKIIGIPSRLVLWPFRPFLNWINTIANALVARAGVTPVERAAVGGRDAETIRQLVRHSAETGTLEPAEEKRISEVLRLEALTAGDLQHRTTPPTSVNRDATVADVQAASQRSGHLRVLIREADGNFVRVVHVRDTLDAPLDAPAERFARPAICVPEDMPVSDFLSVMRQQNAQFALVERHGLSRSVVTLRDVLGRILRSEPSPR